MDDLKGEIRGKEGRKNAAKRRSGGGGGRGKRISVLNTGTLDCFNPGKEGRAYINRPQGVVA